MPTKQRLRSGGIGAAAAQDGYSNNESHDDGDRHAHRRSQDRGYGYGAQWTDAVPYGGGSGGEGGRGGGGGAAEAAEEPRRMSAKTPAGAVSGAGVGVGAWGGTPSTGEAASWERAALEAEEAYRRRFERESKAEEPLTGAGLMNAGGAAASSSRPGHDGGVGVKTKADAVRRVVAVADASVCVDNEVTSPNRGGVMMPGQGQSQRQGLGVVAGLGPRSGSVGGDVIVSDRGNISNGRSEARVSYPAPRNISFGGAVGPSPRQQQQHEPLPQQHGRRQSEQLGQPALAPATAAAAPVAAERDVHRKTDAAAIGETKVDPLHILPPPLVAQKRKSSPLLHPSPHHHQRLYPPGAAAAGTAAGATLALQQTSPRPLFNGPRGPPLESLGLPHPLLQYYLVEKKISHLYPWQAECLSLDGVSDHRSNLVYCAPTSGGKSLVAEVLLVKRLIAGLGSGAAAGVSNGKGGALGLMILPFVTLCHERAEELSKMLKPLDIEVRRFYGGQGGKLPPGGGNSAGLIVATPEKANRLVTQLIEEERMRELAVVVVDELHMVQDPHRGATLELMLTKLLFAAGKASHLAGGGGGGGDGDGAGAGGGDGTPSASAQQQQQQQPMHDHLIPLSADSGGSGPSQLWRRPLPLQIVGMSATLPNVDGLARWLNDAQLYETDYRPVVGTASASEV